MSLKDEDILKFNMVVLRYLLIWPKNAEKNNLRWNNVSHVLIILSIMPILFACTADLYYQFVSGMLLEVVNVTANILSVSCLLSVIYTLICFNMNRDKLLDLVPILQKLNKFGVPPDQAEIEKTQARLTAGLMLYGLIGSCNYFFLPFVYLDACEVKKQALNFTDHVPCGYFTRIWLPFRFDYFPVYELVLMLVIYSSYVFIFGMIAISVFQTGYIMHIIGHMRTLKEQLRLTFQANNNNMRKQWNVCVEYHIEIIGFCTALDEGYKSICFLHLSLTSFILSVLAYQFMFLILFWEKIRFMFHIFGWLTVLFLLSYNGQQLIDESLSIGNELFNTDWPNTDISIQYDIIFMILRAQQPLVLRTGAFGYLSYEMFLKVISTAYSYFTLLATAS